MSFLTGTVKPPALAHANKLTHLTPAAFPGSAATPKMRKSWTRKSGQWTPSEAPKPAFWKARSLTVDSIEDMHRALVALSREHGILVTGEPVASDDLGHWIDSKGVRHDPPPGFTTKDLAHFRAVERAWLMLDLDREDLPEMDPAEAAAILRDRMPECFRNVACVWGATSGHGFKKNARLRLIFMLDRPLYPRAAFDLASATGIKFDPAIIGESQPIYIEPPRISGGVDPVAERWGLLPGSPRVAVPADLPNAAPAERAVLLAPENVVIDEPAAILGFIGATYARNGFKTGDFNRRNNLDGIARDAAGFAISKELARDLATTYVYAGTDDAESADARRRAALSMSQAGMSTTAIEHQLDRLIGRGLALADKWAGLEEVLDFGASEGPSRGDPFTLRFDKAYDAATRKAPVGAKSAGLSKSFTGEPITGEEFGTPSEINSAAREQASGKSTGQDAVSDQKAAATAAKPLTSMNAIFLLDVAIAHGVVDAIPAIAARVEEDLRDDYPKLSKIADEIFGAYALGDTAEQQQAATNWRLASKAAKAEAEKPKAAALPTPWNIATDSAIPPRQFIFGKDYIRGVVSATIAPGGRGKSALLISEAVSMACGVDLYGRACKPLKVFYFNAEDEQHEIDRRVQACLKARGLTVESLGGRLFTRSGHDAPMKLAEVRDGRPTLREDMANFETMLRALAFDVAILDPFVSLHLCSENDTVAVDLIVKGLAKVAAVSAASVMLVHHTRKPGTDGANDGQITSDDSRGAKSLVDACRKQRLLNPMKEKTAQTYGIEERDRWRYVAISDGKNNLSPRGEGAWFKLESQGLDNGTDDHEADNVGVAVGWLAPETANRGTDDQEKVAGWLAREGDGAEIEVKAVCAATGLGLKNFRRDVLGGADEAVTSHGRLLYAKPLGKKAAFVRLFAAEIEEGDAFGIPDVTDGATDADGEG